MKLIGSCIYTYFTNTFVHYIAFPQKQNKLLLVNEVTFSYAKDRAYRVCFCSNINILHRWVLPMLINILIWLNTNHVFRMKNTRIPKLMMSYNIKTRKNTPKTSRWCRNRYDLWLMINNLNHISVKHDVFRMGECYNENLIITFRKFVTVMFNKT